jgi:ATP-dependent helicase/nuclease subunit B
VTGLLAADWYDTTDLRRAAAAVLHGEPGRGREIGEVVLFLPQELSPSATALLRELPAADLRVVAGRTGEERADAGVISAVRGLGVGDGDVPVVPVTATRVITANGTAVRPVIERAFPRTLLGLLGLPDHRWRRDEVLALLAGAPVLGSDGQLVPVSRWERISRAAGVVAGGD